MNRLAITSCIVLMLLCPVCGAGNLADHTGSVLAFSEAVPSSYSGRIVPRDTDACSHPPPYSQNSSGDLPPKDEK